MHRARVGTARGQGRRGRDPVVGSSADAPVRLYPDLRSRALSVDLDGVAVVVASRNDLIRLKAGTGRDRDLLDIGDLLALDE